MASALSELRGCPPPLCHGEQGGFSSMGLSHPAPQVRAGPDFTSVCIRASSLTLLAVFKPTVRPQPCPPPRTTFRGRWHLVFSTGLGARGLLPPCHPTHVLSPISPSICGMKYCRYHGLRDWREGTQKARWGGREARGKQRQHCYLFQKTADTYSRQND